jgi:hypothetical protein
MAATNALAEHRHNIARISMARRAPLRHRIGIITLARRHRRRTGSVAASEHGMALNGCKHRQARAASSRWRRTRVLLRARPARVPLASTLQTASRKWRAWTWAATTWQHRRW